MIPHWIFSFANVGLFFFLLGFCRSFSWSKHWRHSRVFFIKWVTFWRNGWDGFSWPFETSPCLVQSGPLWWLYMGWTNPYKWVTGLELHSTYGGYFTPFVTEMGPPCMFGRNMFESFFFPAIFLWGIGWAIDIKAAGSSPSRGEKKSFQATLLTFHVDHDEAQARLLQTRHVRRSRATGFWDPKDIGYVNSNS